MPDDNPYPFTVELSDFQFVQKLKSGKGLRFTLTWRFIHPKFGLLGQSVEGCLIRKVGGRYIFGPPLSKFGPMQSKQLFLVTTDLADLIIRLVREHRTKDGRSYLSYVGTEEPEHLRALSPAEVDGELPAEIRLEDLPNAE